MGLILDKNPGNEVDHESARTNVLIRNGNLAVMNIDLGESVIMPTPLLRELEANLDMRPFGTSIKLDRIQLRKSGGENNDFLYLTFEGHKYGIQDEDSDLAKFSFPTFQIDISSGSIEKPQNYPQGELFERLWRLIQIDPRVEEMIKLTESKIAILRKVNAAIKEKYEDNPRSKIKNPITELAPSHGKSHKEVMYVDFEVETDQSADSPNEKTVEIEIDPNATPESIAAQVLAEIEIAMEINL